MGNWQIFDADGVAQDDHFDDGLAFQPGEDGFSTEIVSNHAASCGKDFTFSLISVPNWHMRIEAEQAAEQERVKAEKVEAERAAIEAEKLAAQERAEAELTAMLNPSSVIRNQINAKFDAMLATLPGRAKDIEELRAKALEEVEE